MVTMPARTSMPRAAPRPFLRTDCVRLPSSGCCGGGGGSNDWLMTDQLLAAWVISIRFAHNILKVCRDRPKSKELADIPADQGAARASISPHNSAPPWRRIGSEGFARPRRGVHRYRI